MSDCSRPEGCVCGGDLSRIRAACGWFVKPDPDARAAIPTDMWWARRWLKSASPGEIAAMRTLLADT